MNEKHFLTNIFNDQQFKKEELEIILPKYKKVDFLKNDFLLNEGKVANQYWFIEKGFVRSFATDPEGKDISTNFYSVGDVVIDWPSFFLRNSTRENIQALTDCICWQLDFETFQHLFHSIETFREHGRARLVGSYFALKQNSISMITDQAKERYKKLVKEKPQIVQNVPLKQLATYLGVTDTSLSRIRKEIASE
ncbi:Crp/Fnr family transcriptional regulator [Marivirga sp. S37H4]|uniref:Crp/Fnr family transcriptional regulator n=1 Tax=Marivirga aurantiaca TaxID=2802615 RepID=A0A935CBH7_9BACT|nr:Crp/Fnr family transcriptional regulator [Marivirga aurantiaca]MBK6267160.1 Crp/Fnr family transcriptional regulator [Marivirga aurantiaca]